MYFSVYTREELAKMDKREALSQLGVQIKDAIIQPARCKCGSYSMVVLEGEYLQCSECGEIYPLHVLEDTMFKRKVNGNKVSRK